LCKDWAIFFLAVTFDVKGQIDLIIPEKKTLAKDGKQVMVDKFPYEFI